MVLFINMVLDIIDVRGLANRLLSSIRSNDLFRFRTLSTDSPSSVDTSTQPPVRTPDIPSLAQNSVILELKFDHPHIQGNVIKHIPRPARPYCAAQLTAVINKVIADNKNASAWSRLFQYGQTMLLAPPRAGRRHNLVNILKKRSADNLLESPPVSHAQSYFRSKDESSALAAAVRSKLEDGNIKAAVRILCSDDKPAPNDQATLDALRRRHPAAPADRRNLPNPSAYPAMQTTERDVIKAIRSFPAGSSAGPDGLRPQHLLDLINCQEAGHALVMAITALVNLFLQGWCPSEVTAVLFGGKLLALTKKSGGVRPIAIGYTWRRLAAKCANYYAMSHLQDKLLPFQLGVNTPGGCEAVVHATRQFTSKMTVDDVVVKLDFSNAFNCVRRDVMLQTVADELPCLYRFCHLAYGNGTKLRFGDHTIWSLEGAQQGDPLGPLLFCLTIQPLLRSLSSELIAAYLDDLTLGGRISAVAADVTHIIRPYHQKVSNMVCNSTLPNARRLHHVVSQHTMRLTASCSLQRTQLRYSAHLSVQVRL
jgi:hypothetical protein